MLTKEELQQLLKENPDLLEGLVKGQVENLTESQMTKIEAQLREKLGIDEKADIGKTLEEALQAKAELDERKRQEAVAMAISEGTKELPYGELNESFVEAVKGAKPQTPEAAKTLIESKRKEYDALVAKIQLKRMGYVPGVQVVGPVIERQANVPEYARGAFELQESLRKAGKAHRWSQKEEDLTPNELFTQLYLESFDRQYKHHLIQEARLLEEAELTSDLNLPYSVSRMIVAEALPTLVALSIFDVGMTDQSPSRIYYEAHTAETGYTVTVTDEVVTGGEEGTWYDLDYARVTPGSVTVTSNPAGTTYVENTDFVIDYANGKILFLEAGDIGANDVLVAYTYTAIRKGENAAIERAKVALSYKTLEIAADRLATEISREAVVFSRSQIGWDATSRTLANLVRQISRKIDQGLLYMALTASLQVASNSGGTWTDGTDSLDTLVKYLGYAKVKVANRYYEPTFYLLSVTNADKLSNWDGFSRGGFPNAVLNSAGYAGSLKGLPIYASTEFPDGFGLCGNREVVMHRVFQTMQLRGPYPSYSSNKLLANDQYYAEEFNGSDAPVVEKASHVIIA